MVSTMKTLPKCTYISNCMSKKPRGTHAERPNFLSLNSGIDSLCKGLKLASAASRHDQEHILRGSYPEISMEISSTHDTLDSLNTSTKDGLHRSPEIEGYHLRGSSSHSCRGRSGGGIAFPVSSRTIWCIRN